MAVYVCDENGIAVLNRLASQVKEHIEVIEYETDNLFSAADEYAGTLGPHLASLTNCLEEIKKTMTRACKPAMEVSDKLAAVAKAYQEILDDDPFGDFDTAGAAGLIGAAGAAAAGAVAAGTVAAGAVAPGSPAGQNQILNTPAGSGGSSVNRAGGQLAGVSQGQPMSFSEADSGHVNPGFSTGDEAYYMNCQSCVVTFEARKRGYNVRVKPFGADPVMRELARDTSLAWIDPATGQKPSYIYDENIDTPEAYMQFLYENIEQGGSYTLEYFYKSRRGAGHIVNIDRDEKGQLRIKDNQPDNTCKNEWVGEREVMDYLERIRFNDHLFIFKIPCGPKLLRIDNLEFNHDVVDKILEAG